MSEDIEQQLQQLQQQISQLKQANQYEQALSLASQAYELAYAQCGENHPATILNLRSLADIYLSLGRYAEAGPLYRQAIDVMSPLLGDDHPIVVDSLVALGESYEALRQYTEAEPLYRQVSDAYRRTEGEESPNYARSLHNLALLYQRMGDTAAAEPLYRQALEIARRSFGETNPTYALGLSNLASLYNEMGRYDLAEPLYRQVIDIHRQTFGENHVTYARSLGNLAGLYEKMGQYAGAEPLYRQACTIFLASLGVQDHEFVNSVTNLGKVYRKMGNYGAAETILNRAMDFGRQAFGETDPAFAATLTDLGELYWAMGRYRDAEPLLKQALAITRAALGEEHYQVAETLNGLGEIYWAMGNYATAEPLLRQALYIRRVALGEAHPEYANSLNNLGELYRSMGNYTAAVPLFRQAIEVFGQGGGPSTVQSAGPIHNLAGVYQEMGAYSAAEPLYRQALDILIRLQGEKGPHVATVLDGLATLYSTMENTEEAEQLFERALEIQRQQLGEHHEGYAIVLNNLASVYWKRGDRQAVERLYRKASETLRAALGEEHPNFVRSLYNLAFLYANTARQDQAYDLMDQATGLDDRILAQLFSVGSESQRMAYLSDLRIVLYGFLALVRQFFAGDRARVGAVYDLVLRRKAIGAEALAVQRDAVLGGRYPHLTPKLTEWSALRAQIAARLLAGPGQEGVEAQRQLLAQWNARREQIEQELVAQIPEMNLERSLGNADRQAVARALPSGAVLVEFVHALLLDFASTESRTLPPADAHYLAFVIAAGEPDAVEMIDLGEAGSIDQMIAAFRASVTREQDDRGVSSPENISATIPSTTPSRDPVALRSAIVAAARNLTAAPGIVEGLPNTSGPKLRAAVFDRLLPFLKGHTRLFLAPDGDLARIPFEILPTDDGRCLIDDYHISYLSVGRDALRFGVPSTGQPSAHLVAADPDFDLGQDPASPQVSQPLFPRLSGARWEGQAIAAKLGVQPLLDDAVLETTLKTRRSPRVLHLATHGFFLPNPLFDAQAQSIAGPMIRQMEGAFARLIGLRLANPLLRSGLVLAGANTWLRYGDLPHEAEDGLLFAEDVTGLDLLNTELVVLSACDTGLGDIQVGEGVFGLRRAFTLAGAKTLVMSLWKVPDQQTQELMIDFYERILIGAPRSEALRAAQLAMKVRYPNPLYWGAFICQGDPGALPAGDL